MTWIECVALWGSAVVLDRSQAPSSSLLLFCAGMQGGAWEQGYIGFPRLPQQLHEQHALLSLLFWAYSACFFLLCCFNSTAHCHVRFYVALSGTSVVCGVLGGSLWECDCAILMTPKLHFENFRINYPLDLLYENMAMRNTRLSVISNISQVTIVIQWIQNLRYNVRIHTYIHTYRHHFRSTR